jgi:DNA mismatch endonuclease, patch repair protein
LRATRRLRTAPQHTRSGSLGTHQGRQARGSVADFLTARGRSQRMARIRSSDTKPEIALRSALHRLGLRFRKNVRSLPGTPDIVLRRYSTVILVHGCFWHRHTGCAIATTPKSNTAFWEDKFARNVARDARNHQALLQAGLHVEVVWECELSSKARTTAVAERLAATISRTSRLPAAIVRRHS